MPFSQQWAFNRVCSMLIVTSASSAGCGKMQSITASGSLQFIIPIIYKDFKCINNWIRLHRTIFFIVTNMKTATLTFITSFSCLWWKAHSLTFQEWLHIYGHRSQPFPVWLRFSGPLEPPGKPLHCFCKIEKKPSQWLYNHNYSDNISNIQWYTVGKVCNAPFI